MLHDDHYNILSTHRFREEKVASVRLWSVGLKEEPHASTDATVPTYLIGTRYCTVSIVFF